MSHTALSEKRKKFFDYLEEHYPGSSFEIKKRNLIGPHFFSPFFLKLPRSVFVQAGEFIKNVYEIKESESYQSKLPSDRAWKAWPQTPSLLTCFDFHYSEKTGLKLIEINTNASLYVSHHLFLKSQGGSTPDPEMKNLLSSFEKSFFLNPGDSIFILDRDPENEGLYFEFLLFQEWLEKCGYKAEILSLEEYGKRTVEFSRTSSFGKGREIKPSECQRIQKVYNRLTDFYFSKSISKFLMDDYIGKKAVFSPNPRGYFLLSDKKRQSLLKDELEFVNPDLAKIIPGSKLFSEFESQEALWHERKKYFFKPSQSFGGKGAFRGQSISRKTFNEIYSPDFLAQEFYPAGQKNFNYEGDSVNLKFDLRFYVFEGQIQNYLARLYQGQTTNVKTKWGGLAPLYFS